MKLKALETHALLDARSSGDRLHFAASPGVSHLYTLQADDELCAWSLSKTLIPARGGRVKLPVALDAPAHQFSGSRLLLWEGDALVAVSTTSPAKPELAGSFALEGLCSCVAVGDSLYVERLQGDEAGYGLCALPATVGATPEVKLLLPGGEDPGTHAVVLGERVVWAAQQALVLMRCSPPGLESSLRYDSVVAYPLAVSAKRLAVLETSDDARTAVSFVDLEGKKLRKVASFHPRCLVRAWCLSGDRLTVVLRSSKRLAGEREYVTSLAVFDVSTAAQVASLPLPFVEVYGKGETQVVWLGVVDDLCAVLLSSGALHRFSVQR